METAYLKEFVVLSRTGNYQKAADELFISQPSLTRHIKLLEKELGASVFDRSTRRVELSEAGQCLLPYAEKITRLMDECGSAVSSSVKSAKNGITVGSIPAMTQYGVTDILASFKHDNPACTINVVEDESPALLQYLRDDKCDFAFLREYAQEAAPDDMDRVLITQDTIVTILPRDHRLASEPFITIDQLKNENLLLLKGELLYRKLVAAYDDVGFHPKFSFTGTRVENIVDMVSRGLGVSFVLRSSAMQLKDKNIAVVDFRPEFVTELSLAYKKSKRLNQISARFLDSVKRRVSEGA